MKRPNTTPTEPGWYELKDGEDTPAAIVADGLRTRLVEIRVVERCNQLIVLYPRGYYHELNYVSGQWCGPLPEPEEEW